MKGCTNCAFSHGGQYFAAVSGNSVHIISTYTGHPVGNLRAHLNKVQSIWWAPDDFHIVTAGKDGAVYEWDLKTCTRSREHVIKGSAQTCVIGVNDGKFKSLFLSATSDCKLREMDAVDVFQDDRKRRQPHTPGPIYRREPCVCRNGTWSHSRLSVSLHRPQECFTKSRYLRSQWSKSASAVTTASSAHPRTE